MLEPSRRVSETKEILDYLNKTKGYTYGAFLGADEFEEYAISLFVLPDGDGYKYVMYVGFENGLGTCQYASCDVYYSELEVLERLRGFEKSYSRWR